jgi:hypothetical protein
VERSEAEAIYGQGREPVVDALVALSARLEAQDAQLAGPIAVGMIDAILTRTAETLEPVYDELLEQTRAAGGLNIDETGSYLSGEARTLWGAFGARLL